MREVMRAERDVGNGTQVNMGETTKRSISPARQRLIGLMQEIGFGRIENLDLVGGEPVFDPPPRVTRTAAPLRGLGKACSRSNVGSRSDAPIARLFRLFDQYGSLLAIRLDVKDGRLHRMEILDPSSRPARGDPCRT